MNRNIKYLEREEREHFDLLARKYDINYGYYDQFVQYKIKKKTENLKKYVKKIRLASNIRILELGTGTGEYTKYLSKILPRARITGLDISSKMIKEARRKCSECRNVKFVVASAYKNGLPKESFDLVCGFYTLHHLNVALLDREIVRVLKPNGAIFFCEPNILNPVVYYIKSNKKFKKKIGDSPEEWAINPLTVPRQLESFRLDLMFSEFVFPIQNAYKFNLLMDRITSFFGHLPVVKMLAGTVVITGRKNE